MGVTININGLSMCHESSGGIAVASLPNVCLKTVGSGVVPIPFSNLAKSSDLANGSKTVKADGGNSIAVKDCVFSTSTGDMPGDMKGVVSHTTSDEAKFISYSNNVKIEGKNACRLSDKMTMNKANTVCMGGLIQPTVPPGAPPAPIDLEKGEYWIRMAHTYVDGEPMKGAPFKVVLADGTVVNGNLDGSGKAEIKGLKENQVDGEVQFVMGEDTREWTNPDRPTTNPHYDPYADPMAVVEKINDTSFMEGFMHGRL
jgi:hypothetical protein